MDDWDYLNEFDVVAKLPGDFFTNVESKKWQERKDALQALLDLLTANRKLDPKANYGELISTLKKILEKDSNINVCALAAKCLKSVADGLRKKFAPHAPAVIPTIFEKFKEKKPILKDPLVEAIDAVAATVSLESLQDDILAALEKPNPSIKMQTDLFLYRAFKKQNAQTMPKKTLKAIAPLLVKHSSDPDAEVRDACYAALGSAMRAIGEKPLHTLVADIVEDKLKMGKINEHCQKATEEVGQEAATREAAAPPPPAASTETPTPPKSNSTTARAEAPAAPVQSAKAPVPVADEWEFMDEVDILAKMPADFDTNIASSKWIERRDALQALLDLLTASKRLNAKANYGELISTLKRILEKDNNINVCALAAKCLKGVAEGLRKKFAPHTPSVIPIIFEKFKEKKPILRDPLVEAIDAVAATVTLESMQEELVVALEKPNPSIKIQTDLFLYRTFKTLNAQTMPKKTLKAVAPLLVRHSMESDAEVRDACYAALGSAMRCIGEKPLLSLVAEIADDKLKMGKIQEYCQKAIEEAGPETAASQPLAVEQPPAKPATPARQPQQKPSSRPQSRAASPAREAEKEPVEEQQRKPPAKSTASKADDADSAPPPKEPMIVVNEDKAHRLKEEKNFKILKWNFATPTEEHISQLQTSLGANAKGSLISMLFNKDFKMQLKGVEEVIKACDETPANVAKNSDLLLKWATLRFLETNPTVLIKVLEMARLIIQKMSETGEAMSAEEINAFLPYLLLKLGEPKDIMRQATREIVDELSDLCGPFRLTPAILDALKSKNSRQRAELLAILDDYVQKVGLGQLKTLQIQKAIATQVSDRDANVRNAAINALVACYKEEGEQMWKSCGKIPDKDRALVEERIKRTGALPGQGHMRIPSGANKRASGARIVVPDKGGPAVHRSRSRTADERDRSMSGSPRRSGRSREDEASDVTLTDRAGRTGRYNIDEEYVESSAGRDAGAASDMLHATFRKPRRSHTHAAIPPMEHVPASNLRRTGSSSSISSIDTMGQLERAIQNISSGIPDVAKDALDQVQYLLNVDEQAAMLLERIELVLRAVAAQLHIIWQMHAGNEAATLELLGKIINLINPLLQCEDKYKQIILPPDVVQSLLWEIVCTIDYLNPLINANKEGAEYARLYNICAVRLCNRLDMTDYFIATLQCMKKSLQEQPPSEYKTELFHKCLNKWGTLIPMKQERLRLIAYARAANDFYKFYDSDEELRNEIEGLIKTIEVCWQKTCELHGDAVMDAIRRIPDPHPTMIEYVNRTLAAFRKQNPAWKAQFPGSIDEQAEAVHPSEALASARQAAQAARELVRPELQILMDNVIRDLNGASTHCAKLADYLEKNPQLVVEYNKYADEMPLGNLVKRWIKMRQASPIQSLTQQTIVDSAQRMFTWKSRLTALRSGQPSDGGMSASMMSEGQVLQARDINSESMTSDLPIPPHLVEAATRSPEEEQARQAAKNKRRTVDRATMDKIRIKLNGIGD